MKSAPSKEFWLSCWTERGIRVAALGALALLPAHALATDCDWALMGLQGLLTRYSESGCEAISNWSALIGEAEAEQIKSEDLVKESQVEPALAAFVQEMQAALAEVYGEQPGYRLFISSDSSVNAYAIGSSIVVHRGLLLYYLKPYEYWSEMGLPSEYARWAVDTTGGDKMGMPEVAFVIAHEVGHNTLLHTAHGTAFACLTYLENQAERQARKEKAKEQKRGFWRTLGGGIGAMLRGGTNTMLTALESVQEQQGAEREADTIGTYILWRVGLDPAAAESSLVYLGAQEEVLKALGLYTESKREELATILCGDHPLILARASAAADLARQLQKGALKELPAPVDLEAVVSTYQEYRQGGAAQTRPAEAREERPQTGQTQHSDGNPHGQADEKEPKGEEDE